MALNISEFLTALNEGEQAKAAVPALQAQVDDLKRQLDAAQAHNQGLEQNISGYRTTIDNLNERVRALREERDDASFRGLEVEDKLSGLLKAVRAVGGAISGAVDKFDPPKAPEPTPEPVPVPPVPVTEGKSDPTPPVAESHGDAHGQSVTGQADVTTPAPAPQMPPVLTEEGQPAPSTAHDDDTPPWLRPYR